MSKMNFSIFLICFGLCACSSGSDSELAVRDPNNIASEFESPTGALTDANATDVVNRYVTLLEAGRATLLGTIYIPRLSKAIPPSVSACFTTSADGKELTLDVKCWSDAGGLIVPDFETGDILDTCTGSGTLKSTVTDLLSKMSSESFGYHCPKGEELGIFSDVSDVTGTSLFQIENDEPSFACSHFKFTVNGVQKEAEGCGMDGPTGDRTLVDGDGGPVIINDILFESVDASCSTLCVDVLDKSGSSKVACEVKQKHSDCAFNENSVIEVANCVVTRDGTCYI